MSAIDVTKTDKEKQTYEVEVFAPRNPSDRRSFSWSKHLTVGQAAAEAAANFGIQGGQPTLAKDGKPLDRSKQLVAAGVRDGDVLEIVDAAGGV
ncbi:MAG: hypothetical protein A3F92_09455 [Candidatus Rokubacteria bacterium RIFCSPLOWO2_12_FULL_71_22]|nr:MAG: hypothetical protein A3F92_09455 [Candidatus Rokubacteria bacterium RIFCSPLOWO2_12_FULL_71_22]